MRVRAESGRSDDAPSLHRSITRLTMEPHCSGTPCCSSKHDSKLFRSTGTRGCAPFGAALRYCTGHAMGWLKKASSRARDHPDDRRVRQVELTPKGRALITRGFGEHAAAMEDVAGVLSKNERLTLLRLLKKFGKHAAETRG